MGAGRSEGLERTLTLPDGRTLTYGIYGATAPSGAPPVGTVFYFHGFPASHLEAELFHRAAREQSLCLVAADRPGMGGSTYQPDRSLLDWPSDVIALADHLAVERFAILGVSGGGPYALACYRALPRARLAAVVLASGLYPKKLGLAGMMGEARALLLVAPRLTGLVSWGLDRGLGIAARDATKPEKFEAILARGMKTRPEGDREMWEQDVGGFRRVLLESIRRAFAAGGRGPAWEAKLFGSDWGFELSEIEVEAGSLSMWHGGLDVNSPWAMAKKAAELLSGAELHVDEREGHASLLVRKADEILATLKRQLTT